MGILETILTYRKKFRHGGCPFEWAEITPLVLDQVRTCERIVAYYIIQEIATGASFMAEIIPFLLDQVHTCVRMQLLRLRFVGSTNMGFKYVHKALGASKCLCNSSGWCRCQSLTL